MIRRILAAVVALVLAGLGAVLVMAYASQADERALSELETVEVLVATEAISEGTEAASLGQLVSREAVPLKFLAEGAVESLDELSGMVVTENLVPGEQLVRARFLSPEQLRAQSAFVLPEEAENLHQVTISLAKHRALGGNIAPGDTVGVFVSLEPESSGEENEGEAASVTHLTLHKVLVTRVEGGAPGVSAPTAEGEEPPQAAETILVTLALDAPDAERLVFSMEFGQVWLSYEPAEASEDGTEPVGARIPERVRNLFE